MNCRRRVFYAIWADMAQRAGVLKRQALKYVRCQKFVPCRRRQYLTRLYSPVGPISVAACVLNCRKRCFSAEASFLKVAGVRGFNPECEIRCLPPGDTPIVVPSALVSRAAQNWLGYDSNLNAVESELRLTAAIPQQIIFKRPSRPDAF
ncbi:hypothetical protein KCP75_02360 [Salmonella enterica subsp. enterica]|nr:hypothetical protein KCP75_02360 [Salmonella enterica subsp. enterica]